MKTRKIFVKMCKREKLKKKKREKKIKKEMSVRVLCYLGIFSVSVIRFLNWGAFPGRCLEM